MMIKVGDKFSHVFTFTQDDVQRFAELTGDVNSIHLDEEYAADTIFKKPIIHGFLAASVFSKVFGTLFPGNGSIYKQQALSFDRPMFVDVEYEAHFEVLEINAAKHTAIISTRAVTKANNKKVITGEATVMHNEKF